MQHFSRFTVQKSVTLWSCQRGEKDPTDLLGLFNNPNNTPALDSPHRVPQKNQSEEEETTGEFFHAAVPPNCSALSQTHGRQLVAVHRYVSDFSYITLHFHPLNNDIKFYLSQKWKCKTQKIWKVNLCLLFSLFFFGKFYCCLNFYIHTSAIKRSATRSTLRRRQWMLREWYNTYFMHMYCNMCRQTATDTEK